MTERSRAGREPFEAVYLYQDICSRNYGSAPCTANLSEGGRKCFNTLPTCQDVDNYEKSSLIIRFCSNRVVVPNDGNQWLPFLSSVRVTPGSINPGGGDRNVSPLGKRATISVTFKDYPSNDRVVDPYSQERLSGSAQQDGIGYDPLDRSTFWAKWRARNRYYMGRKIVYVSGYIVDGVITDAVERTFFITGFNGPTSSDSVTITGQDILSKASNDKAKAPAFSNGKLSAALTDSATSFTVSPSGVGAEYPSSGYVRISDEILSFTRTSDNFTVARGLKNTEPKEHDSGDGVQICLEYVSQRPDDIVYDLLSTYAGIADEYLDTVEWASEVDSFMPRLYGGMITEPTGVQDLLSEICEQMYFYIWFDERNDLVKMRAVRPAEDEEVYALTDSRHMIQDSVNITDASDQLITSVVVRYAQINPAKDLSEPSNYAVTDIISSNESSSERLDESRTKVIYSRWLDGADGAAAIDIGNKLLARYSAIPRKVSFGLDAKDRDVWVGSFAQVTHRRAVDDEGIVKPVNIQIMTANESVQGSSFSYMGQEFVFESPPDIGNKTLVIGSNQTDINLRSLFTDKFGVEPLDTDTFTVTIRSGAVIGSSSSGQALATGSWPSGLELNLVVESGAIIVGKGGLGGRGGNRPAGATHSEMDGGAGKDGIEATFPINITNFGVIGGGGGGGGGGASKGSYSGGGGGSGAGYDESDGGIAGTGNAGSFAPQDGLIGVPDSNPLQPNRGNPGGGGLGGGNTIFFRFAGDGGTGGFFGTNGANGSVGSDAGLPSPAPTIESAGTGGAAGRAVVGISNVTWINKGIVRGAEV